MRLATPISENSFTNFHDRVIGSFFESKDEIYSSIWPNISKTNSGFYRIQYDDFLFFSTKYNRYVFLKFSIEYKLDDSKMVIAYGDYQYNVREASGQLIERHCSPHADDLNEDDLKNNHHVNHHIHHYQNGIKVATIIPESQVINIQEFLSKIF